MFMFLPRLNRSRGWLLGAAGLGLLTASHSALAVCDAYPGDEYFSIGSAVTLVANSADVGEALGAWIPTATQWVTECGSMGSYSHINKFNASAREVSTYSEGGRTYSVFETGVPGVGYVLEVQPSLLYNSEDGTGRHVIRSGVELAKLIGEDIRIDQVFWIRFIKTGITTESTYTVPDQKLLDMTHFQLRDRWVQQHWLRAMTIDVVHRPLCHVAPKTVEVTPGVAAELTSQWSYGRIRKFTVDLNCEAGAGRVQYYVEPAGTTLAIDRMRGILDVQGGAVGVGLQLLDASDVPIELGKTYWFGASSADGARSETFGARYIKTAASADRVVPGAANATARFRIHYP